MVVLGLPCCRDRVQVIVAQLYLEWFPSSLADRALGGNARVKSSLLVLEPLAACGSFGKQGVDILPTCENCRLVGGAVEFKITQLIVSEGSKLPGGFVPVCRQGLRRL